MKLGLKAYKPVKTKPDGLIECEMDDEAATMYSVEYLNGSISVPYLWKAEIIFDALQVAYRAGVKDGQHDNKKKS